MSDSAGSFKPPTWLPDADAALIDAGELVPYVGAVAREAEALARRHGVFIAVYRAGALAAGEHQLCRIFGAAALSPAAIGELEAAERRHPGTAFVAYARPLRRR